MVKRFKTDKEDFDCIFTMPQEKIFAKLKDENVFRQPRPINVPEHMKDKSKFCMFHNNYGHTLAACRNLYGKLKGMMRKGLLLKYLKNKAPPGSVEKSWEIERMVVKVIGKGVQKDTGTSRSAKNL